MRNGVKVSGSQFFAEALAAYSVSHVFQVPTVAVPALFELAIRGVVGITAHSEKAAAYMADGYARVSGKPGICMSQTIGAANLASGLREPKMMGSPVIAITGGRDPLTKHRNVYQEVADLPLFEPLTKENFELDDVRRVPDLVRQAFRAAVSGRPGPVHIELRGAFGQVLDEELEIEDGTGPVAEPAFQRSPSFRPVAADEAIEAALAALRTAERPVILAGGGARVSGAETEILRLAELLSCPVATSLTGKGLIDETGPYALGPCGASSRPPANRALAEADLVFAIGSRLGSQTTDGWRIPVPGRPLVQLDIEPSELGRTYPNSVSLNGDARATLARMIELAGREREGSSAWLERTAGFRDEYVAERAERWQSSASPIRPERLGHEITQNLPDDAVLLCDTGHAGLWAAGMVDLRPGQSFLRSGGSLGWAYPASLGAKCAAPERPVVGFAGDGGLYFHLAELETAARHGIASVLVLNNNNSFSQDLEVFQAGFGRADHEIGEPMWKFRDVSVATLAEEMGCYAEQVTEADRIGPAIEAAIASGRPAVVEVVTDVNALAEPPYGGASYYDSSAE